MITKNIKISVNGNEDHANLLFAENVVKLVYSEKEWIGSDSIPFVALQKLRQQIEDLGILIFINGSRKDVFPSGMQMNMGMTNAYINIIGKAGGDVIDIFDDCDDINLLATVNDQQQFHQNWIDSIM